MSSSAENGSEIDRPSKRRPIHSDSSDSDSVNEDKRSKHTRVQTSMSDFPTGPCSSSPAVVAAASDKSDSSKIEKGQHWIDTVIEVYRFGHTKCHYKRYTIVSSSLLSGSLSKFKKSSRQLYGLEQDARRANIGGFKMDVTICERVTNGPTLTTFTANTEAEWQNVVARLKGHFHQYQLLSE